MDHITEKLLESIYSGQNESQKSSHWHKYTKDFKFKDGIITGISGFSSATNKFLF